MIREMEGILIMHCSMSKQVTSVQLVIFLLYHLIARFKMLILYLPGYFNVFLGKVGIELYLTLEKVWTWNLTLS